jgi:hypothetical protein
MDEVNPSISESPAIVPHPKQTIAFPKFLKHHTFPKKIKQESPVENAIS